MMWHQKQAEAISLVGTTLKVFDLCRKGLRSLQSKGTNEYLGKCSLTKWHMYTKWLIQLIGSKIHYVSCVKNYAKEVAMQMSLWNYRTPHIYS